MSTTDLSGTFWYCEDHRTVEPFAGCGSSKRIGPFDTAAEAEHALQTIADRERRYDAADAAFEGGQSPIS